MEVTVRFMPGFGAPNRRLGELYKFVTPISDVNGVVLGDIQQVMVESLQ